MQTVTFNWPTGPRRYLFHGSNPGRDPARPLVLMLHGTGGSAEFAAEETRWAAFADAHNFLVAFPDALPVDPNSPPSFLTNPKRWNDGSTRPGDPFHTDVDDVTFIQAVIDDAIEHGPADPKRVYLTGFSNGAAMAFRFAAERPTEIAAVAPVAGYCHVSPPLLVPPVVTAAAWKTRTASRSGALKARWIGLAAARCGSDQNVGRTVPTQRNGSSHARPRMKNPGPSSSTFSPSGARHAS